MNHPPSRRPIHIRKKTPSYLIVRYIIFYAILSAVTAHHYFNGHKETLYDIDLYLGILIFLLIAAAELFIHRNWSFSYDETNIYYSPISIIPSRYNMKIFSSVDLDHLAIFERDGNLAEEIALYLKREVNGVQAISISYTHFHSDDIEIFLKYLNECWNVPINYID